MHNIILCAALLILGSVSASAQFYTITKETEILPEKQQKVVPDTLQRGLDAFESCKKAEKDSLAPEVPMKPLSELYARKVYARVSHEKASDKGTEGTNNLFVVACHRIPFLLKHNTFKVNVALCNITQYHKTCIKSCTKPCTRNIQ